ncbi:MAG: DUF4340 domain-containing protein [Planctomycetota bacterium]
MNETLKTLAFVAVAGGLVAAAVHTRDTTPSTPEVFSLQGQPFFPEFEDWSRATSLEVYDFDATKNEPQAFKVEFKDGVWRIPSKNDYPADAKDQLSSIAGEFAKLERGQLRSRQGEGGAEQSWVQTQEDCGVIDPRAPLELPTQGRGRRIVLRDRNDAVLADLIVGAEVEDAYGKRFVRRADEKQIYTATLDMQLSTTFADWIETDLLQLDTAAISSITVRRYTVDEEQIRLGRIYLDEEDTIVLGQTGVGQWTVDGMREDQQASMAAVDSMTDTLGELTIKDVLPFSVDELFRVGIFPTQDGVFSNEGELRVDLNTGVRYNLRFGEVVRGEDDEEGLRRYLWVDAEPFYAALPNPDDAEARKAADAKVQELNDRFGGWFYVIGARSFDALRPTRAALLEARTEPIDAEGGSDFFPPIDGHGPGDGDGHGEDDGSHDGGLEDGGTTPPEDGEATPPEDGEATPPQDGGMTPPEDGGTTPPEDGGTTPPEDREATPPGDEGGTEQTQQDPVDEPPPAEQPPVDEPPPAEQPQDAPAEQPPVDEPPPAVEPQDAPAAPGDGPAVEPQDRPAVPTEDAQTEVPAEGPAVPTEDAPEEVPVDRPVVPTEEPPVGPEAPAAGHSFRRAADHWEEQLASADKALELAPDYVAALFLQGEARLRLGRTAEALEALEHAIAQDPQHARAFALLAEACLALGQTDRALETVQRACELAPSSPEAARVLTQVLLAREAPAAAVAAASRGLELDPQDVELLFLRGDAAFQAGDAADAARDWERGLSLLPEHPQAEAVRAKLAQVGR